MLLISYTQFVENLVDNTEGKLYIIWRVSTEKFLVIIG